MAGSASQARRSAAVLSSVGTPSARKARISVSAAIDSTGGRSLGSTARAGGITCAAPTVGASLLGVAASGAAPMSASVFAAAASCLRRDQRRKKPSGSLIFGVLRDGAVPPERFRVGAVALALMERPLDVILGDECGYVVAD